MEMKWKEAKQRIELGAFVCLGLWLGVGVVCKIHTLRQKDLFLLSTASRNSGTGICIVSTWPGEAFGSLCTALSVQGLTVGVERCCLQLLAMCGGSMLCLFQAVMTSWAAFSFPLAGCLSAVSSSFSSPPGSSFFPSAGSYD